MGVCEREEKRGHRATWKEKKVGEESYLKDEGEEKYEEKDWRLLQ